MKRRHKTMIIKTLVLITIFIVFSILNPYISTIIEMKMNSKFISSQMDINSDAIYLMQVYKQFTNNLYIIFILFAIFTTYVNDVIYYIKKYFKGE